MNARDVRQGEDIGVQLLSIMLSILKIDQTSHLASTTRTRTSDSLSACARRATKRHIQKGLSDGSTRLQRNGSRKKDGTNQEANENNDY